MQPSALILTGYGINCDIETAFAFKLAGAIAKRVHINDIIDKRISLDDFQILAIPGGFSFGDDIASGKVLANRMKYSIKEELRQFIQDQKLIVGVCNGFQVMVKSGILPYADFSQETTVTFNDSGRFEDRWVYLKINQNSPCVFTKGIESLYLPVRHGEGKFIPKNSELIETMDKNNQTVAQYVDENGKPSGYPWNPNGSVNNIAAICSASGRIFGIMPHPEAFLRMTNHPRWTRLARQEQGQGFQVFKNAVDFVKDNF